MVIKTTDATHLTQARKWVSRNCWDQLWLARIEWSVELWWLVLNWQLGTPYTHPGKKSPWRIVESRAVCRYVYGGLSWLLVDVRRFSPLWVAPFPRQKILFTGLESGLGTCTKTTSLFSIGSWLHQVTGQTSLQMTVSVCYNRFLLLFDVVLSQQPKWNWEQKWNMRHKVTKFRLEPWAKWLGY